MAADAKILVVDDEPHIRRILQFLLEKAGFSVIMAENGEDGLKSVTEEKPDLVLLDVMMPKMDGFAVLEAIRGSIESRRTPVIMLTAKGENSEKVRGLRGGANDYLVKPFNQEELLLRISNMLESDRSQRDANPLTGLPGNRAIERELHDRVEEGDSFAFLYIDMDRFKAFNDFYGYSRGDEAITFLARVLRDSVLKSGTKSDFIGHIGGDDFVAIAAAETVESLAQEIIDSFAKGISDLYDPEDSERGYVVVRGRAGVEEKFEIISITVALVNHVEERFQHTAQLSDVVAELKKYGKGFAGNIVVKERRLPDLEPEFLVCSPEALDNENR